MRKQSLYERCRSTAGSLARAIERDDRGRLEREAEALRALLARRGPPRGSLDAERLEALAGLSEGIPRSLGAATAEDLARIHSLAPVLRHLAVAPPAARSATA